MSAPAQAAGADARRGLRLAWAALAVLWLGLVLLPVGRTSELAVLGAIVLLGVALWRREPLADPRLALALALFGAYWLPGLVSALDAVAPARTWGTVLADLRFLPLALAAVLLLRDRPALHAVLLQAAGLVVLLWALDALVQAASGWSLGGPLLADRVSGVFGADNLKLGPTLAVLSPFALEAARLRHGRAGFVLAWALVGAAVLLAGARAGWISYGVVTLAFAWRLAGGWRAFAGWALALALGLGAIGALAYAASERFAARVDRTLGIGAGADAALDYALAWRLPIWQAALSMAAEHPVNGVGVRGYREAYAEHAPPGDRWLADGDGEGAYHPHQLLLELAAETGLVGLLAWAAAAWLLLAAWRRQPREARARGFAPALALTAMVFPLNTHFAFYSSFWGLAFWWLLAVLLAGLARAPRSAP